LLEHDKFLNRTPGSQVTAIAALVNSGLHFASLPDQ
jgi:hypothetical protein